MMDMCCGDEVEGGSLLFLCNIVWVDINSSSYSWCNTRLVIVVFPEPLGPAMTIKTGLRIFASINSN